MSRDLRDKLNTAHFYFGVFTGATASCVLAVTPAVAVMTWLIALAFAYRGVCIEFALKQKESPHA